MPTGPDRSRFLLLNRRLNTCRHRYSCFESIIRRMIKIMTGYMVWRLPFGMVMDKIIDRSMWGKGIVIAEIMIVSLIGILYSAGGCTVRYLHEEVV